MNQERNQTEADPPEQTWGQGEGPHEPTIPADDAEEPATTYSDGRATRVDDPDAPLSRETEGMDR